MAYDVPPEMTVTETDLPGVGKKFTVPLEDDTELVIVIHNTGKREVYLDDDPDEDNEKLFEVSDNLSRVVGSILEGAYFQPIASDAIETMLDEETLIEWVKVPEDSSAVGESLESLDVRGETGASVVAIKREDGEVVTGPGPEDVVEAGDTIVVMSTPDSYQSFLDLVDA